MVVPDTVDFRDELADALKTSPEKALDAFAERYTVTNLSNMDIAMKLTNSLLAFHKPKAPKIPDVSLRLWLETCGAGVADSEELAQELMLAVATANCSAAAPLMAVALWETRSFHLTSDNFETVYSRARELAASTPAQFQTDYETLALGTTPSQVVPEVADKIDRFLAISADTAVAFLEDNPSFICFESPQGSEPTVQPTWVFVDARTTAERAEDLKTVSELSSPGNENEHKRIVVVKLRKALYVDDEIDFNTNQDIRAEFFIQKLQLLSGQGAILCVFGSNLDEQLKTIKRVCRVSGGFSAMRDFIIERDDIALLDALTIACTTEFLERQEHGDFPDQQKAPSRSTSLSEQLRHFAKGGVVTSLHFVKKIKTNLTALPLRLGEPEVTKKAAFVISESRDASPVSPSRLAEEAKIKVARTMERLPHLKKGDHFELSDLRIIAGTRDFFAKKVVSKDKADKKLSPKLVSSIPKPPPPPPAPSTVREHPVAPRPPPPPPAPPAAPASSAGAAVATKAASAAMKGLNTLWKGAKSMSTSLLEKIADGSVEFPRVLVLCVDRILVFDCTSGRAKVKSNHRVRELSGFSFDDKTRQKVVLEVRGKDEKKIYLLEHRDDFVQELNTRIQTMHIKTKTTEEVIKRPSIADLIAN